MDYLTYGRYLAVPFAKQNGPVWEAGNNVQGKTAEQIRQIVAAIKAMETDPIQQEIFNKMQSIKLESFIFKYLGHAQSEILQRLETLGMMFNFNSDQRFEACGGDEEGDYSPAHTDAPSWRAARDHRPAFFSTRQGTPYDGIMELCEPPPRKTYGECWGAINACVWYGSARAMGPELFNYLYRGPPGYPSGLNMDPDLSDCALRNTRLARDLTGLAQGKCDCLVPGDWVYFKNYNYAEVLTVRRFKYVEKWIDPLGDYFWSGENALYCGKIDGLETFEGLGARGSKAEIQNRLRIQYNVDLSKVINNVPGAWEGMEIKKISESDMDQKIKIINVKRLYIPLHQ